MDAAREPLTVIVRRRPKPGTEAAFEAAMQGFIAFALAWPGNLGIHVVRPAAGGPREYTVVDRFADLESRVAFKQAPEYREWMQRLRNLTEGEPFIEEQHGLAGWFTPPGVPKASTPARIKMAAVTFVGVYPLTSSLPEFFTWLLPAWHPLLVNLFATASIVAALSWIVMPFLTKRLARWLFPA